MKITAQQMRESRESYNAAVKAHRLDGFCEVRRAPVQMFAGTPMALISDIQLKNGPQRVSVVDLTDRINDERPFLQAALFGGASWKTGRPALDENGEFDHGVYALIIFPDEGSIALVCEDGGSFQCADGEIIVSLTPGSPNQQQQLQQDMLDEYADSLG